MTDSAAITAGQKAVELMMVSYDLEADHEDDGIDHAGYDATSADITALIKSMTNVQPFTGSRTGAFGYLGNVPGVGLALAFAGTDFTDMSDVYADISSIVSISFNLGRAANYSIGRGFAGQFAELITGGLGSALANAMAASSDTKITITGHSLGGAIANIAAVYLVNTHKARVRFLVRCTKDQIRTAPPPPIFILRLRGRVHPSVRPTLLLALAGPAAHRGRAAHL